MATDNKKVSGYLPQYIFDLFEEFREKRSLSASSALIAILSEYFQVDQKVDRQTSLLSGNDFVSREQFESLEGKLSGLSSSLLSELDKLVEQKISSLRSELLNSLPKHIEAEAISVESSLVNELLDEPLDELPSELLSEPLKSEPLVETEVISVDNELPSELSDESPQLELESIDSTSEIKDLEVENTIPERLDFILAEPSESLSGKHLAKRLNVQPAVLSHSKNVMPKQKFVEWARKKDPDGISWRPATGDLKSRVKAWVPVDDTPSELLSRLKEWVATNPE